MDQTAIRFFVTNTRTACTGSAGHSRDTVVFPISCDKAALITYNFFPPDEIPKNF